MECGVLIVSCVSGEQGLTEHRRVVDFFTKNFPFIFRLSHIGNCNVCSRLHHVLWNFSGIITIITIIIIIGSQWPRGLKRGSADECLLGLRVRIPPVAWMFVSYDCCVLSGRRLCIRPITRPEAIIGPPGLSSNEKKVIRKYILM